MKKFSSIIDAKLASLDTAFANNNVEDAISCFIASNDGELLDLNKAFAEKWVVLSKSHLTVYEKKQSLLSKKVCMFSNHLHGGQHILYSLTSFLNIPCMMQQGLMIYMKIMKCIYMIQSAF